jgi:hypothetical protein
MPQNTGIFQKAVHHQNSSASNIIRLKRGVWLFSASHQAGRRTPII